MLLDHVPFEAEFRTPDSAALAQIINTQEYGALTQRLKRDLNIHVLPPVRQLTTAKLSLDWDSTEATPIFYLPPKISSRTSSSVATWVGSFSLSTPLFPSLLLFSIWHFVPFYCSTDWSLCFGRTSSLRFLRLFFPSLRQQAHLFHSSRFYRLAPSWCCKVQRT